MVEENIENPGTSVFRKIALPTLAVLTVAGAIGTYSFKNKANNNAEETAKIQNAYEDSLAIKDSKISSLQDNINALNLQYEEDVQSYEINYDALVGDYGKLEEKVAELGKSKDSLSSILASRDSIIKAKQKSLDSLVAKNYEVVIDSLNCEIQELKISEFNLAYSLKNDYLRNQFYDLLVTKLNDKINEHQEASCKRGRILGDNGWCLPNVEGYSKDFFALLESDSSYVVKIEDLITNSVIELDSNYVNSEIDNIAQVIYVTHAQNSRDRFMGGETQHEVGVRAGLIK